METRRLKTITILILALLNLALLVLLFSFRYQQSSSRRAMEEQLFLLYENSGVTLSEDAAFPEASAPPSLSLVRDLELEANMARFLLGSEETVEGVHQGGGIYTYSGKYGTVSFRSNGAVDYVPVQQEVDSPAEFCEEFCETFGYTILFSEFSGTSGSLTAQRVVNDTPVYNCTVFFLFQQGRMVSLSGSCLSTSGSTALSEDRFTAVDALVKFLDYRNSSGVICSAVTQVSPVYELQSSSSPLHLNAKWQVSTDTYQYYVDCITGNITRN